MEWNLIILFAFEYRGATLLAISLRRWTARRLSTKFKERLNMGLIVLANKTALQNIYCIKSIRIRINFASGRATLPQEALWLDFHVRISKDGIDFNGSFRPHNPYKAGSVRCRFRASRNSSLTQTSNVFARSISISPFSNGSSPYIS